VSIIDLEVVSHDSDLGQATQRGRNRMLSEAEQILEVEYRLITISATEAKRIQDILDDPHESARVSASFKEVLSEKELASGRPLLIKEVSTAPATVTTMVEAMSSSIAPSSTSTTTKQEEFNIRTTAAKEQGADVKAIMVGVVAAIVGCLSLGCLARFLLGTRRRERDFPEQSSTDEKDREDLEAGLGQQGENPEMYPTLLKITSQSCSNNTEMKPRSPLQKEGFSESTTTVSTAYVSTASNTSVSTVRADIPVKPNVDTEDSESPSEFAVALPLPASQDSRISMVQDLEPRVEMQGSIDLSELEIRPAIWLVDKAANKTEGLAEEKVGKAEEQVKQSKEVALPLPAVAIHSL